jgi:hypothetical protein
MRAGAPCLRSMAGRDSMDRLGEGTMDTPPGGIDYVGALPGCCQRPRRGGRSRRPRFGHLRRSVLGAVGAYVGLACMVSEHYWGFPTSAHPRCCDVHWVPPGLSPMLAVPGALPTDDRGWAYEVKFDGVRVLAGVADDRVTVTTRNDSDVTASTWQTDAVGRSRHLAPACPRSRKPQRRRGGEGMPPHVPCMSRPEPLLGGRWPSRRVRNAGPT